MNTDEIPDRMFNNGVEIDKDELQEAFAELFETKVNRLSNNAIILTNRFTLINNKIEYDWLNKSWNCYKLTRKSIFLT